MCFARRLVVLAGAFVLLLPAVVVIVDRHGGAATAWGYVAAARLGATTVPVAQPTPQDNDGNDQEGDDRIALACRYLSFAHPRVQQIAYATLDRAGVSAVPALIRAFASAKPVAQRLLVRLLAQHPTDAGREMLLGQLGNAALAPSVQRAILDAARRLPIKALLAGLRGQALATNGTLTRALPADLSPAALVQEQQARAALRYAQARRYAVLAGLPSRAAFRTLVEVAPPLVSDAHEKPTTAGLPERYQLALVRLGRRFPAYAVTTLRRARERRPLFATRLDPPLAALAALRRVSLAARDLYARAYRRRRRAREAVWAEGKKHPLMMLALFGDPDYRVRLFVLEVLPRVTHPLALVVAVSGLQDPDAGVRALALDRINEHGPVPPRTLTELAHFADARTATNLTALIQKMPDAAKLSELRMRTAELKQRLPELLYQRGQHDPQTVALFRAYFRATQQLEVHATTWRIWWIEAAPRFVPDADTSDLIDPARRPR